MKPHVLHFTRAGAERLRESKRKFVKKLKDVQSQKSLAYDVGGDCWHDNSYFEDLENQERMLNHEIRRVNEEMSKMRVIDGKPTNTDKLSVGLVAYLIIDGVEKRYLVGGYGDGDMESVPQIISYTAPLIWPFIGEEVGHEAKVMIAGKIKEISLEDIQFPEEPE